MSRKDPSSGTDFHRADGRYPLSRADRSVGPYEGCPDERRFDVGTGENTRPWDAVFPFPTSTLTPPAGNRGLIAPTGLFRG
jgi:hypothetical protein